DDRREEVDREDERALVVELVDGRVVGRVEADEQILRLCRNEPAQKLLQARRRVLRGAPAGGREVGQLDARRHAHTVTAAAARRSRRRSGERNVVPRRVLRGSGESFTLARW